MCMTNTIFKNWCLALGAAFAIPGYAFATPAQSPAPAVAPQDVCTGVVVDAEGEPLIGATVTVEGSKYSTMTDIDGRFSVNGIKPGAKVTVTYIGYGKFEGKWDGQPMTITLKEESSVLDEVVVMGYGVTQKRAKVTNSVAKVENDVLTIGANANPAQALAGAVSGVKVNITSGDPSATPDIVIRGGTNWSGSSAPLIVVDGQIRSSMSDINPNDIAEMQILKDAGATALYGARAANGVVLISTKQGQAGKATVTLNAKFGMNYYSTGYDMVDAGTYLYYNRLGTWNTEWAHTRGGTNALWANNQPNGIGRTTLDAGTQWNVMTMTDDNKYLLEKGWQSMQDPISDATIIYRDIKGKDVNINTPAYIQDYNLSFSGGNDRGKYYASLGFYKADGAFTNTNYERYNFALTGSYQITKWLESNSKFTFTRSDNKSLPGQYNFDGYSSSDRAGWIFQRIFSLPPTLRLLDEDNQPAFGQNIDATNYNYQEDKFHTTDQTDKFQMTQAFTAQIIDGLSLKGTMSWFYNEWNNQTWNQEYQTSPGAVPGASNGWNKTYSQYGGWSRYFDQTYNLVANYQKTFAEAHTINVMAGWEFYKRQYKTLTASGSNSPTGEWYNLGLSFTGTQSPYKASTVSASSGIYEEKILSWFARAEYDYMDKYLFAATIRKDGYSRLINNRWGTFPGVSGGWVFTKENFWADNANLAWLNYGKLRASYGLNGVVNSNTIGYYTLYGTYSAFNYNGNYGYRIGGLPNPNLRWEKTRTFDIGLTLGFLQNRFNLDLTYYNRLTSDKYANYSLPATTGFSSVVNNNGKFRNQGLEIDINTTLLRTGDFQWTLGANLTYNKNVIVSLPENEYVNYQQGGTLVWDTSKFATDENGNQIMDTWGKPLYETKFIGGLQVGQEPNHMIGYKKAFIVRDMKDVPEGYIDVSGGYAAVYADEKGLERLQKLGKAAGAVKLMPGDVVWLDRNGDNVIDSYDQYDLGNRTPHWTGGFNTSFKWKGFQLYARFDMGFDFTVYDANMGWWLGCGQGTYSFPTQIKDTWTEDNPNAKYPRFVWASVFGTDAWIRTSDVLAQQGAYLACRELQLSYQIPEFITKKFGCQNLTISVTGQNLGYFKKCTIPLPDRVQYTNGNTGGWGGTYNVPRQVLFGLNMVF